VTVLFPKNIQIPKDLGELHKIAQTIKDLLQTGQYSLQDMTKAA